MAEFEGLMGPMWGHLTHLGSPDPKRWLHFASFLPFGLDLYRNMLMVWLSSFYFDIIDGVLGL
jgi:hypothetical protein